MRVTVLASGSGGNATLFRSAKSCVLVDCGLGPKALEAALAAANEPPPEAIVVTHAHGDHFGHAGRVGRARDIPVYLSAPTSRAVRLPGVVQEFRFEMRDPFAIGDLVFTPLPVPHDAAQVALRVEDDDAAVGLATDLGEPTGALIDLFSSCDAVMVEANYDPHLLARGPYPEHLRRRIASARGHLSNAQTATLLGALPTRVHTAVLLHLSEQNNSPELALETARRATTARVEAAKSRGNTAFDVAREAPVSGAAAPPSSRTAAQLGLPFR
ncbi:MAG: MBL fold metallo-hydrolase [Myxococcales bacterium]|nr:MBL fold metallo-hydrolase [Myxococcales bacterium]